VLGHPFIGKSFGNPASSSSAKALELISRRASASSGDALLIRADQRDRDVADWYRLRGMTGDRDLGRSMSATEDALP